MKRSSLSLRLIIAGGLSVMVATALTGVAISYLFELYYKERLYVELENHLIQLTGNTRVAQDGTITVLPLSDHRFEHPLSGLYWQVSVDGSAPAISPSLWDQPLAVAAPRDMGEQTESAITAPFGPQLMALSWRISVAPDGGASRPVLLTVATDLSELSTAAAHFRWNVALWMGLLAVTLIVAAWVQVRVGLKPLDALRVQIERIKAMPDLRLRGDFPREVAPLADEVNELLDQREATLDKTRLRAADLAHGLKTPLTVMAALSNDVRQAGAGGLAGQIDREIASMRTFIERELARTRIGEAGRAGCDLKRAADQVVDAIRRLPAETEIAWEVDIPAGTVAPFDDHDMSELLGNLLDNARRHARSRIVTSAEAGPDQIRLTIADDGPGVPDDMLTSIVRRGERLDTDSTGFGLGLSIVRDLADAHGCELVLENRAAGGLAVSVSWPRPPVAADAARGGGRKRS